MPKLFIKEHKVAIEAVVQACAFARKMQGTLAALDIVSKDDLSPVTITDFSVQALINRHLLDAFPTLPIMGEEDTLLLRSSQHALIKEKVIEQLHGVDPHLTEHQILEAIDSGGCLGGPDEKFWVLDPIDGTKGFIRSEQYAVALALIEAGEVVLGVLGCPRLVVDGHKRGGILVAVQGEGAFLYSLEGKEERRIKVSSAASPEDVIYCEPHAASTTHSHAEAHEIAKQLKAHPKPFQLDSQCKYALVALGEASIYLRIPQVALHREKIWDHAAGMIVVEEAGGKVTDLEGKPLDFSCGKTLAENFGILATNHRLHAKTLDAIHHVLFRQ